MKSGPRAKTNKAAVGQITFSLSSKASSSFILSYWFPVTEYTDLPQYKTKYLLPVWNFMQQFFQHAGTQISTKLTCIIKQYLIGKHSDKDTTILHNCILLQAVWNYKTHTNNWKKPLRLVSLPIILNILIVIVGVNCNHHVPSQILEEGA